MAESPFGKETSWSIRLLRQLLTTGGRLFPGITSRYVYRIWFRTQRYPVPLREHQWLKTARERVVDCASQPVTVYEWGEGPVVLLVHGWSGRGAQLGGIASALAESGYCAVAIDFPGHGKTPGSQTNGFAMAGVIRCIAQHYGAVHGIVTHSFGAVPSLYLLRKELDVARVVCICPPDTMEFLFGMFVRYLGIPATVEQRVKSLLERDFGHSIWQEISPVANVVRLRNVVTTAALIVHDADDREVGIEHGQALADAWPGARLHRTTGLGHRRILRHKETIGVIAGFIAGTS